MFNIIQLLEDKDIDYITSGKETTKDSVNINCPFCDDSSHHLGIHKTKGLLNCWKCGKHSLRELIEQLFPEESCAYLLYKYSNDNIEEGFSIIKKRTETKQNTITLPNGVQSPISKKHFDYWKKRGFNPTKIEKEWNIKSIDYQNSEWCFRTIIPIYNNFKLVSYQGRDVTNKQKNKYKTCTGTNIKQYLYGIDYVKKNKVIIVEGVTDVWKLGKGNAVATFGVQFSLDQIKILLNRGITKVFILFDPDAPGQLQASKLGANLKAFGMDTINRGCSSGKDPATIRKKELSTILNVFKNF